MEQKRKPSQAAAAGKSKERRGDKGRVRETEGRQRGDRGETEGRQRGDRGETEGRQRDASLANKYTIATTFIFGSIVGKPKKI